MSGAAARKTSFAAYLPPAATRLVLGSLPGDASLRAGQYYAHPRNAFWPIIARLADRPLPLRYHDRLQLLDQLSIGLWDVCASAERPGSLDQQIRRPQANPLGDLLAAHPQITLVGLNGTTAARLWQQLVAPQLPPRTDLRVVRLPSTSPAAARLTFAAKLAAWHRLTAPSVPGEM
jgi:double-stranded uracil-DNA glycosylase